MLRTSPVGSFAPNDYGLYDMAGNVLERCWDVDDYYYYASGQTDPRGPDRTGDRVVRGGSWGSHAHITRIAQRPYTAQSTANGYIGFRCVRGF